MKRIYSTQNKLLSEEEEDDDDDDEEEDDDIKGGFIDRVYRIPSLVITMVKNRRSVYSDSKLTLKWSLLVFGLLIKVVSFTYSL